MLGRIVIGLYLQVNSCYLIYTSQKFRSSQLSRLERKVRGRLHKLELLGLFDCRKTAGRKNFYRSYSKHQVNHLSSQLTGIYNISQFYASIAHYIQFRVSMCRSHCQFAMYVERIILFHALILISTAILSSIYLTQYTYYSVTHIKD